MGDTTPDSDQSPPPLPAPTPPAPASAKRDKKPKPAPIEVPVADVPYELYVVALPTGTSGSNRTSQPVPRSPLTSAFTAGHWTARSVTSDTGLRSAAAA